MESLTPSDDSLFTALVMGLCGVLIEKGITSREELVGRAVVLSEQAELTADHDLVKAIGAELGVKKINERFQKEQDQRDSQRQERALQRSLIQGR
jgi:hypothetical protein